MNKKANIPITILVLGVVAICVLTIGSFVISLAKFDVDPGLGLFEDIKSDIDEFYFYINTGVDPSEAAENIGATINSNGELEIEKEIFLKINYAHKLKIK